MKKIITVLMICFAIVCLFAPAFATEVEATDTLTPTYPDEITTPFEWEYLASIAGAAAATLLIVQFAKVPLDKVWKIPTRLLVYFLCLAIMLVATHFTSGLTLQATVLAALNAFISALTAYGAYEVTFAKLDHKTSS